jgi:hypothetical protein
MDAKRLYLQRGQSWLYSSLNSFCSPVSIFNLETWLSPPACAPAPIIHDGRFPRPTPAPPDDVCFSCRPVFNTADHHHETGFVSYAGSFLCHAHARIEGGHPHLAGFARPQERGDDANPDACDGGKAGAVPFHEAGCLKVECMETVRRATFDLKRLV